MDILRQSVWLVVNQVAFYSYGFLLNCMAVGQALMEIFNRSVGACMMPVFGWANCGST